MIAIINNITINFILHLLLLLLIAIIPTTPAVRFHHYFRILPHFDLIIIFILLLLLHYFNTDFNLHIITDFIDLNYLLALLLNSSYLII